MESPELIKQVKKRPAIWSNGAKEHKKMAIAWQQICKMAWTDFPTRTTDEKRTKCLELQKKWDRLRQSFVRDHLRQVDGKERGVQKSPYYDQLLFLAPTIRKKSSATTASTNNSASADVTPRLSTSSSTSTSACTSLNISLLERDAEEDRQFLLSLVSFMQDVPRSDKLALRSEILQVISKYTDRPRTPPALSQEY
ncbi:uncharacterized protein LOC128985683 [Macrosteles quadrilineatus]|uniref:uncharacterized protein LOC128985683 n=1 Tax=Macrosteles quadrilineatus TaxID=74068 RepID=UPI0023E0FFE9|nr:uncharacterized protein LOC128985683 [Macrosteles quadrilineatus]